MWFFFLHAASSFARLFASWYRTAFQENPQKSCRQSAIKTIFAKSNKATKQQTMVR
jgi:hypothetical protein